MGQRLLLANLNLTIKPGEFWAIVGPNGCGKTTFLHTLAGLSTPFCGDINLQERALQKLSRQQISKQIGLLFQDYALHFPQTVWDYCLDARFPHQTFPASKHQIDKEITIQSLKQLDLWSFKNKNIQHLSGGEKRRLQVASILTQDPLIYLLDEPTNHLDIKHQIMVLKIFKDLSRRNKTILMSLHDLNLVQQFCDFVICLFPDGQCIQGPKQEVMQEKILSQLFQYPLKKIASRTSVMWSFAV